jgi:hypothetical protein
VSESYLLEDICSLGSFLRLLLAHALDCRNTPAKANAIKCDAGLRKHMGALALASELSGFSGRGLYVIKIVVLAIMCSSISVALSSRAVNCCYRWRSTKINSHTNVRCERVRV